MTSHSPVRPEHLPVRPESPNVGAGSIRLPAEWARHDAMWIGWPSDADLWRDDLVPARREIAALVRALTGHGGRVQLVASHLSAAEAARVMVDEGPGIHVMPMGDIWLRDTGPIFVDHGGAVKAVRFRFNGWGGKYELDGDNETGAAIALEAGAALESYNQVLEGGAVDWDGRGTVLTTRQCLLNPNRNVGWTQAEAERVLGRALGARKLIWLGDGLLNDHTDGHVDNIARFIAPGVVACMTAFGDDDPNADVLAAIEAELRAASDADGRALKVVTLPSPGLVTDEDDEPVPASHMNFLIGNGVVVVPTYGTPSADAAVDALRPHFPGRAVIGLPSGHILTGGGSFHCISQQQPDFSAVDNEGPDR